MTNVLLIVLFTVLELFDPNSHADPVGVTLDLLVPGLILAGLWGIFRKAGQPGWAAIVPIYAELTLLKIISRPWWWVLLMMIPLVGAIVQLIMQAMLAPEFRRGSGTALGLILLPPIFLMILGFGPAEYRVAAAERRARERAARRARRGVQA